MISIIICSINPDLLSAVTQNINDTIGVPFEIIASDNRGTGKGICQVYNESVLKAKYELLCFIHEDIIIKTNGWGHVLLDLFKDPGIGLIGVAGSNYRPLTPSSWGGIGPNTVYKNIIQSFKHTEREDFHFYVNPTGDKLAKVICLDGVWLSTTKTIATATKFDDVTFKGFHCYDIDFSISVSLNHTVAVTFDILINHLSEGRYDEHWMKDTLKFNRKWQDILPLSLKQFNAKDLIQGEKATFKFFIEQLIAFGYPITTAFKILWSNNKFYNSYKNLFFKLNYYILIKYSFARKTTTAKN